MLSVFQVDLENLIKVKFAFMYHMQVPGSELESWPFWEYEMHLETLSDIIKKKKQQNDRQSDSGDATRSASSLMRQATSSMPKAPTGQFKMPKIK